MEEQEYSAPKVATPIFGTDVATSYKEGVTQEHERQEAQLNTFSTMAKTYETDWFSPRRTYKRYFGYETEEGFDASQTESWKQFKSDLGNERASEDEIKHLLESKSHDQLQYEMNHLKETWKNQDQLAVQDNWNKGVRLITTFADPSFIALTAAATAATGGLGLIGTVGMRTRGAYSVLAAHPVKSAAGITTVADGSLNALRADYEASYNGWDATRDTLLSVGLTSGLVAGLKHVKNTKTDAFEETANNYDPDMDMSEVLRLVDNSAVMEANPRTTFDVDAAVPERATRFRDMLRFDSYGIAARSKNKIIRKLNPFLNDDMMNESGKKGARTLADTMYNTQNGAMYRGVQSVLEKHSEAIGLTNVLHRDKRAAQFSQFARDVGLYTAHRDAAPARFGWSEEYTAAVKDLHAVQAKAKKEAFTSMQEAGVKGTRDIKHDDFYQEHSYSDAQIEAYINKHGDQSRRKMFELLQGSMRSQTKKKIDDLVEKQRAGRITDDELAELNYLRSNEHEMSTFATAFGMMNNVHNRISTESFDLSDYLRGMARDGVNRNGETLPDVYNDLLTGLKNNTLEIEGVKFPDMKEFEAFLDKAIRKRNKDTTGVYDRLKRRIQFDPAFQASNGDNFTDLLEMNSHALTVKYLRNAAGNSALAHRAGMYSPDDIAKWRLDVKKHGGRNGDKDAEMFDRFIGAVYGRSDFSKMNRAVRDALGITTDSVFMSTGGMMGFAATSELGRVFVNNNISQILKGGMRGVLRNIENGTVSPQEAAELRSASMMLDAVNNPHLSSFMKRMDEKIDANVSSGFEKVEEGLANARLYTSGGAEVVSNVGLLKPVDRMNRYFDALGTQVGMAEHFFKGKKVPDSFADLNFTKADVARFKELANRYGDADKLDLGLDKWPRYDAYNFLEGAMRKSAMNVQRSIGGHEAYHLNGPVWNAMLQFRRFMLDSYGKHLMRDTYMLKEGDNRTRARTAASIAASAAFAYIGIVGRAYVQTIGMSSRERKEFLAERLNPDTIGYTVMYYMPYLGMPMTGIGAVHDMIAEDPLVWRTSGFSNVPVPPAVQWLDRALGGVGAAVPGGRELEAKHFKSIYGQNTIFGLGIQNMQGD